MKGRLYSCSRIIGSIQTAANNNDHMGDLQSRGHRSDYYTEFDRMTNGGRVFTEDLSNKEVPKETLSSDEVKAREKYEKIVRQLKQAYKNPITDHPVAASQEEVLQQRVVATCLGYSEVSSRSAPDEPRAGRIFPQQIHPWIEFEEQVKAFTGDTNLELNRKLVRIFQHSLNNAVTKAVNEVGEMYELSGTLDRTLRIAGIVDSIETTPDASLYGRPDFCVMKNENTVSIICQCKSTHNLLLPMTAHACTRAYNCAYAYGANKNKRSIEWSNVAHPIGQLLSYMVDNKHCYGALTSGTRTYFIKIQGPEIVARTRSNMYPEDQNQFIICNQKKLKTSNVAASNSSCEVVTSAVSAIKVFISDAWCVGQVNYLRAWTFMHTLHGLNGPLLVKPTDWIKSTTDPETFLQCKATETIFKRCDKDGKSTFPNDERGSGCNGGGESINTSCNMEYFFSLHQGALELVPLDQIEMMGVLGYGRNGACFKVIWNGTKYAMKQFDIGRDGDRYFRKEICAYMLLQKAWGILVPQPIFLSESFSGGVMFLGLQLGCESKNDDDSQKFEKVLVQIEKEYGIRHNDAECGRNRIAITDCNGVERVVAIDLEDWNEVGLDRSCT